MQNVTICNRYKMHVSMCSGGTNVSIIMIGNLKIIANHQTIRIQVLYTSFARHFDEIVHILLTWPFNNASLV